MIDKPILELLTFGQNPSLSIWDTFFLILGPRDPVGNPLQPISRPCSIAKYPSSSMANRYTWSLMRIDNLQSQTCSLSKWFHSQHSELSQLCVILQESLMVRINAFAVCTAECIHPKPCVTPHYVLPKRQTVLSHSYEGSWGLHNKS